MRIQELLYISNILHIGIYNKPLSYDAWFASKNGPACFKLYQELYQCGNYLIDEEIFVNIILKDEDFRTSVYEVISAVYAYGPSQGISKRKGSAWDLIFNTQNQKFKLISNEEIKKEYDRFYKTG